MLGVEGEKMKIITLLENDSIDQKLKNAHGLSLYIETNDKKIIFDFGPNKYFIKNAKKLNISLRDIDIAVLSHGHFDHGNGLRAFLTQNAKATVYASSQLFNKQYKIVKGLYLPIGVRKPKDLSRMTFLDNNKEISGGITL